ncbi:leucine-rich repeat-containing protein 24-like [Schistocerca serialis cubense]|uniref:leucine-rich repeat-containing protein 24-like n=1 Tax=Schistocerca serialis cubense TaxID=2023355 RepID=UPI00214ED305|nr:leucine-rich repeat-containing protein 24-like [Schistocerca serialis cubense]XP_049937806.1 leucine-rich repeat-containing protein 24-like [Schistocerca serialis cubense]XP_049937807.1 leucine-rich repeat-containing protein 24-like [Schistocerca serialis cubense]
MAPSMSWSSLVVVAAAALVAVTGRASAQPGDWSSNCPQACKCKWVSSRKTAECTNASLSAVPADLSHEVQALYLSGNVIPAITDNAFRDVKLVNLQKLSLHDCSIREIGKRAFSGLELLIELDLSNNQIVELHPSMFDDNFRLRVIYLDHNQIQKVPDGIFRELTFLQTVRLNDNQIEQIGYKAFVNVPDLHTLRLDSNRLATLHPEPFYPMQKLRSLELHDNPWRCDCQLAPLREWTLEHKLNTQDTQCEEPEKLKGMLWQEVATDQMACMPRIVFPQQDATFEATGGEVTMSCQIEGNPPPTAHWVHESQILSNNSDKFIIHEGLGGWLNITLWEAGPEERGEYTCVAKNEAGVDERRLTLLLDSEDPLILGKDSGSGSSGTNMESSHLPLIVALGVGATILAALLIGLSCWLCRSGRVCYVKKVAGDGSLSASNHNGASDEQEKGLITKINPVQKPPRRIDSASSTGDLAEVKMTLIDNGSVLSPSVIDSEDPIQERSLDSLDSSLCGISSQRPRGQPDLLSFPGQVSPAGSSASTVPDSTRLPPQHGPQSPPPQPYVMVTPHAFGTLPYSRSQSPFSPAAIAVPPRSANGYVTIPRRPRVPSWSSPPTPLQLQLELPPRLPVYDNLGPRTTADGSSVLSLNRAGLPPYYSPVPPTAEEPGWTQRSVTESVSSQNCLENDVALTDSPAASKSVKVPPKPPPKPKKKPADAVSGPLYEDEGEDGTEV